MRANVFGEGPAVLLVHGQPGGARDWELVVPLLTGFSILAPDRPGYDGTPALGFFGNAHRAIDLLDRAGVDDVVVAGYSWGGGVALALAMLAPERVRALALLGSVGVRRALSLSDRVLGNRLAHSAFEGVMRLGGARLAPMFAGASGSRLGRDEMRLLREGLTVARHGPVWPTFFAEQRSLLRETDQLERRLGDVTQPAVVVRGSRDQQIPAGAATALADQLPNAELHEIDAGHLMTLEAPDSVADAIRRAARLGGLLG